jgi:DUF1365 family protein
VSSHALYLGRVMHLRLRPRRYRFDYRVYSLLVDVDALDTLGEQAWPLSRNRFNLLSFHDRDHGPADGTPLRPWFDGVLRAAGLAPDGLRVELLCFPRVLGLGFNPLSVWFARDATGALRAALYEVRNTFGEKHHYLVGAPAGGALDAERVHAAAKRFHVSPFIGMQAEYRFRLVAPDARVRVVIDEHDADGRLLVASLAGERRALSNGALLAAFLSVPFLTAKVVLMIHWHALKLWLGGVPFHKKPAAPAVEVTPCTISN